MSHFSFATSRFAALAVVALLLTGKSASADQRQTEPRVPGQGGHFTITVPADADLWFDGVKTTQAGPHREFVSPPLRAGHYYSYDVRVRWKNKGREDDLTRHVTFYAGDQVNLDFTGDRIQTQHSFYSPSSVDSGEAGQTQRFSYYAPSYNIVPRRRVRSLSAQDPTVGRWRTSASDW
jgi:uncharacterized protein (TIGR03000 family)